MPRDLVSSGTASATREKLTGPVGAFRTDRADQRATIVGDGGNSTSTVSDSCSGVAKSNRDHHN
jgi:hypothetical protein